MSLLDSEHFRNWALWTGEAQDSWEHPFKHSVARGLRISPVVWHTVGCDGTSELRTSQKYLLRPSTQGSFSCGFAGVVHGAFEHFLLRKEQILPSYMVDNRIRLGHWDRRVRRKKKVMSEHWKCAAILWLLWTLQPHWLLMQADVQEMGSINSLFPQ